MLITRRDQEIINDIITSVEEVSGISRKNFINKKTKTSIIILLRQITTYMLREYADMGLQEIAFLVGKYHHSTVIHNLKKVEAIKSFPNMYKKEYALLQDIIDNYDGQKNEESI